MFHYIHKKKKKRKRKEGNSKYLLTRFQRRFREGLPKLGPGTLLGARIASLQLLVGSAPNPLLTRGGLDVVKFLREVSVVGKLRIIPEDQSLLFTLPCFSDEPGKPSPPRWHFLPHLTPDSTSSFRKGRRRKPRSSPWPGPPPACILPWAPCSPGHPGRPGAPPRGGAWWLPAGLAAAPAAGRPWLLARLPAHVHEEERSASCRGARAHRRWMPHLGGWRGAVTRTPLPLPTFA